MILWLFLDVFVVQFQSKISVSVGVTFSVIKLRLELRLFSAEIEHDVGGLCLLRFRLTRPKI